MVSVTPVPVKRAGPSDEPCGSVSSSLKRGRLNEFGHKKHEVSGTQEGLRPLELRLCPSLFAVTVVVVLVGVWHGGGAICGGPHTTPKLQFKATTHNLCPVPSSESQGRDSDWPSGGQCPSSTNQGSERQEEVRWCERSSREPPL